MSVVKRLSFPGFKARTHAVDEGDGYLKGNAYVHYQSLWGGLKIEAEDETSERKVLIWDGGVDTSSFWARYCIWSWLWDMKKFGVGPGEEERGSPWLCGGHWKWSRESDTERPGRESGL